MIKSIFRLDYWNDGISPKGFSKWRFGYKDNRPLQGKIDEKMLKKVFNYFRINIQIIKEGETYFLLLLPKGTKKEKREKAILALEEL